MSKKHNEGFTLIEVLIAIVLLGMVAVPICSSLVMSFRMNAKTEELLQAQLVVSSTAEVLMATGIDGTYNYNEVEGDSNFTPEVIITTTKIENEPCYTVVVAHTKYPEVTVTTEIREMTKKTQSDASEVPSEQGGDQR